MGLPPVFTKQALLNRQNSKVYDAFANILDEKVCIATHSDFYARCMIATISYSAPLGNY